MNIRKIKEDLLFDLSERKELLLKIKLFPYRYSFSATDKDFFVTNSIPIIYSLWEGFVQETCRYYLREIERLNLAKKDIHDNLLVFGFENSFKQFNDYPKNYPQDKINAKLKLIGSLSLFFSNEEFKLLNDVNTESKLGLEVLNKIMLQLNLNTFPEIIGFEDFVNYIGQELFMILSKTYPFVEHDNKYPFKKELVYLIDNRNAVSHGNLKSIVVNEEMILRTIKVVEIGLDLVYKAVIEGFEQDKYLR